MTLGVGMTGGVVLVGAWTAQTTAASDREHQVLATDFRSKHEDSVKIDP